MRHVFVAVCLVASLSTAQRPLAKRDPFESQVRPPSPTTRTAVCETTLCRLGADNVKLVGVVGGTATPIAMFEDRAGTGYVARRGALLGPNARITDIGAGCVTLTSFVTSESGRQEPVRSRLCLEREVGEVLDLATDQPLPLK